MVRYWHFVIKKDGDLEFGRPVARSGAHVSGHNKDTIGICLIGLYDFKEIQFDTLKKLLKALKEKHGDVPVNPHNHYTNYKTCPNEKHWPVDPKEILG